MKKIKKSIKTTAKNNLISTREAKKEISYAIDKAIEASKGNSKAEAFWNGLMKYNEQPTPEELIAAIIEKLSENHKL